MSDVMVPTMTKAQAKDLTARIRMAVEDMWALLSAAYEGRAWQALEYESWSSYVDAEFGISRGQSYRLLAQAAVIHELEAAAGVSLSGREISARAAEEIKDDLPEVVEEIVQAVQDQPEEAKARIVEQVVGEHRNVPDVARARHSTAEPTTDGAKPHEANEARIATVAIQLPGMLRLDPAKVAAQYPPDSRAELAERLQEWADVFATKKAVPRTKCLHPITQRIGENCVACGAVVR